MQATTPHPPSPLSSATAATTRSHPRQEPVLSLQWLVTIRLTMAATLLSMYGGGGNDAYFVSNNSTQVIENANKGWDTDLFQRQLHAAG